MVTVALGAALVSAKTGDSSRWITHRDSSGIYSIQFPSAPKVKVSPNGDFFGKPAHKTVLIHNRGSTSLSVIVYKLDNRWNIQGHERKFLDDTTLPVTRTPKMGKVISGPTRFAWQGSPGMYVRLLRGDDEGLIYNVLRGRHYFSLIVSGKKGKVDTKSMQRFVSSLKFL